MTHFLYKTHIFVFALCIALFTVGSSRADDGMTDPALEAGFVPHKALYEVKLLSTKSGAQIIDLHGKMLYEWHSSCDAWISNHQFDMVYEYSESPAVRMTSDFSTYESFDGKTLNFTSLRKQDGDLFEEIRGHAAIDDSGAGEAVFTLPAGLSFDLPDGTIFPVRHTLNVLDAVKNKKNFYNAFIFDGSDEKGPLEINAFVGKEEAGAVDIEMSENIDTVLMQSPYRKIQLAFFPLLEPGAPADYEMSMIFHNNGIISDMEIFYEDFSVSQTLVALEPVSSGCGDENKEE